jgi:hypothetical protein
MSAPAADTVPLSTPWRSEVRRALPSSRVVGLCILLTAWTVICIAGLTGSGPAWATGLLVLLLLALPTVTAAMYMMKRSAISTELRVATAWSWLILLAVGGAVLVSEQPAVVFAVPALALATMFFWPRPVIAVGGVFLLSACYGTLTVYLPSLRAGFSMDAIICAILVGMIWTMIGHRREARALLWPGIVLSLAYIAISALMILSSEDMTLAARGFHFAPWHMAFFLVVGYAGYSLATYERIAKVVLVVGAAAGAYATYRWVVGPTAKELAFAQTSIYNTVGGQLKVFGSFGGNHELSAWTSTVSAFTFAHLLGYRGKWRIVAGVATGLLVAGLLASDVRSGMAGLVAALAVVTFLFLSAKSFAGRKLGSGLLIPLVCAAGGIGLFLTTVTDVQRYAAILHPFNDVSFLDRYDKWRAMLHEIHHPFGQGLGTAGIAQERYGRFSTIGSISVESGYVTQAYQQGYIVTGLLIFALVMTGAGLALKSIATTDRRRALIGIGAVGTLVAYMVNLVNNPFQDGLMTVGVWVILGLGVAQFASAEPSSDPV